MNTSLDYHLKCLCLCFFVMLALSVTFAGSAWGNPYSGLYVFGDSLTDTGNNAIFIDNNIGHLRTSYPIVAKENGVDENNMATYPYASNRYSNGPVWTDYFAQMLGFSATPSLSNGNNYAYGGADIGTTGIAFPVNVPDQLSKFLIDHPNAPSDALYVIEGGGNDVRDAFAVLASGGDPTAVITAYITHMVDVLNTLYTAGGRQIIVWDVPDLSTSPAIRGLDPAVVAAARNLSVTMNGLLQTSLDSFALRPGVALTRFSIFSLVDEILANPDNFGMVNVTDICALSLACADDPSMVSKYFFLDSVHPTTAGHAIFAQRLLADLAVPEPDSLPLMIIGLVLLGRALQKRTRLQQFLP